MSKRYKTKEAAKLAGVTVRTLHHYDRRELLKPRGRGENGYRLSSEVDLVRLQHIAALKFVGLKLSEIREILRKAPTDIGEALLLHRKLLLEQQKQIADAVRVIDMAEQRGYDLESLLQSMEVLRMTERKEWMKQYYSPDALTKIAARNREMSAEQQADGQRRWKELIAEVEAAAVVVSPRSLRAQELATRWDALIHEFTQGDPGICAGLDRLYADKANWPADFQRPYSDRAERFLCEARKLLQRRASH